MNNYNIVASTENEKYFIMGMICAVGAKVTGVSGYGAGFYIQLSATPLQVTQLNAELSKRASA